MTAHGDGEAGHLEGGPPSLAERGIDATAFAGEGNPAHAICVAAERDDYDTILVGRRNLRDAGRSCSGRSLRASSSGAACDVVVVA